MAQVLFDTTYFIDLRRGERGARSVWQQVANGQITAAFSSITAYELWLNKGLTRSDELFYHAMFSLLEEAPLTSDAALQTAQWVRQLPRKTRDRRLRDALIAATASQRGETVYTRNITHFRRYYPNVQRY
ncbi:MAG: type II toxin-antitoxin system VapC family toxin [Chloroflexi bacterium]|nr:type II toxin-antitoxin system VapC family toxin [Chloroflexota bacterium]